VNQALQDGKGMKAPLQRITTPAILAPPDSPPDNSTPTGC
jgi:hypothetical protein